MARLIQGHWYKFNDRGNEVIGQYTGNDQDFECCVCGKGHKARTFNIWYKTSNGGCDYETWGFGREHMPQILEDLGNSEEVIIGE